MGINPGSQTGLRYRNIQTVVKLLQEQGPQTQAELSRLTRLSTATVSNLVKLLVAEGSVATVSTTSNGRRATKVSLKPSATHYAGIIFNEESTDLLITAAENDTVEKVSLPAEAFQDIPAQITNIAGRLGELLTSSADPPRILGGLGIGLPASTRYPQNRDLIIDLFSQWKTLNVRVNTTADLGALAHARRGRVKGARRYLYIDVSSTITAGFTTDGQTYSDVNRIAGDIGHTVIDAAGWLCECGNRGCLNTLAATGAIRRQLHDLGVHPELGADLFAESLSVNPAVDRVMHRAGHSVGQVTARGAQFLGPDAVVVGGRYSPVSRHFIDGFRQGFQSNVPSEIAQQTTVIASDVVGGAALEGAALLGATVVLSPDWQTPS